jgi:hypothetical protein
MKAYDLDLFLLELGKSTKVAQWNIKQFFRKWLMIIFRKGLITYYAVLSKVAIDHISKIG